MLLTTKTTILLTILAISLRIRYDWNFRRWLILKIAENYYGQKFVLTLSRFLLGYLIPPILVHFHYRWPSHAAQDSLPYFDKIKYVRRTRYGPHSREELDELLPVQGQEIDHPNRTPLLKPQSITHLIFGISIEFFQFLWNAFDHHPHCVPLKLGKVKDNAPAILFGHGGGWCVQGSDVQLGQLPAVTRATEFSTFTFNYPLAPEDPFPTAVISALRALSYLKTHRGYESVALLGESAGGNLVCMAALFVTNSKLMNLLARDSGIDVNKWEFPTISCVVSWYSILDRENWKNAGWLWPGLQVVFDLYQNEKVLNNRLTPCEYDDVDFINYPPTLLIAGSYDPLGLSESSKAFHTKLKRVGVDVTLSIYHATHGFVGYPPIFQQALANGDESHWKENCQMATIETCEFVKKHHGGNLRVKVLDG